MKSPRRGECEIEEEMPRVIEPIDEVASEIGSKPVLADRDEDQRREMQRVEPREAKQREIAGGDPLRFDGGGI